MSITPHKTIHECLHNAQNVFLTSHANCADAIGSMCSMMDYLHAKGKRVHPYLTEPVPEHLRELSRAEHITTQKPRLHEFDLHVIVDAGDLGQTGLQDELSYIIKTSNKPCVINIDHHKTNPSYGHINMVNKDASSTCEMVYSFLNHAEHPMTSPLAKCLLTGIVSDTGNFTNAATTEESFQIAAELVWQGANIFEILQNLFSLEESINTLRLWGKIFERLTYNKKYDIAISYVLQKDLHECHVGIESVEVVANFLNYIHSIKAGILLKEHPDGSFKVSMRTNHPEIDISTLAEKLGGGGHAKAAGFTVPHFNRI